jgi:hypothetical protein
MSNYIKQEYDFIDRTKKIIKQYDEVKLPKDEKFEVTLLLNCLVGLLILPQQNWFEDLPTSIVTQKEWGIKEEHISFIKQGETKNVKDIAKHLRNSIAHYHFMAFENKSHDISSIKFEDYDSQKNKTFEAIIPVISIRQFTERLTNTFITEMEKQK